MPRFLILLCVCIGAMLAIACGERGPRVRRSFDVPDFDAITLRYPYSMVVRVGPATSVTAVGNAGELGRMEAIVENGALRIGRRAWTWGRDEQSVTLYVTVPALRAVRVGHQGNMRVDGVEGNSFDASIRGFGNLELTGMSVMHASFTFAAGSGQIRASGRAYSVRVAVISTGDIDLSRLQSRIADVSIVGEGDVRLHASDVVEASVAGTGNITVWGPARCFVTTLGTGAIRCEGKTVPRY